MPETAWYVVKDAMSRHENEHRRLSAYDGFSIQVDLSASFCKCQLAVPKCVRMRICVHAFGYFVLPCLDVSARVQEL